MRKILNTLSANRLMLCFAEATTWVPTGVIALHNASFHELMDMVVYCVEHNSDVNCVAGINRVTPISIRFVPVSPSLCKLDGTPFIRNKQKVKEIRRYLMSMGARDSFRFGY